MEVKIPEEVKIFWKKKHISNILLNVKLYEEPCTQIYNPVIKNINSEDIDSSIETLGKFHNFTFYVHPEFNERFNNTQLIELELKGLLKKKVIIRNIEPIITNICKI